MCDQLIWLGDEELLRCSAFSRCSVFVFGSSRTTLLPALNRQVHQQRLAVVHHNLRRKKKIKFSHHLFSSGVHVASQSVCLPLTHSTTDRHTDRGSFHLSYPLRKSLRVRKYWHRGTHGRDKKNVWPTKLLTGKDIYIYKISPFFPILFLSGQTGEPAKISNQTKTKCWAATASFRCALDMLFFFSSFRSGWVGGGGGFGCCLFDERMGK